MSGGAGELSVLQGWLRGVVVVCARAQLGLRVVGYASRWIGSVNSEGAGQVGWMSCTVLAARSPHLESQAWMRCSRRALSHVCAASLMRITTGTCVVRSMNLMQSGWPSGKAST